MGGGASLETSEIGRKGEDLYFLPVHTYYCNHSSARSGTDVSHYLVATQMPSDYASGGEGGPDGLNGAVREADGVDVGGAGGAGAGLAEEAAVGRGRGDAQLLRLRGDGERGRPLQHAAWGAECLHVVHPLHLGGDLGVAQSRLQSIA